MLKKLIIFLLTIFGVNTKSEEMSLDMEFNNLSEEEFNKKIQMKGFGWLCEYIDKSDMDDNYIERVKNIRRYFEITTASEDPLIYMENFKKLNYVKLINVLGKDGFYKTFKKEIVMDIHYQITEYSIPAYFPIIRTDNILKDMSDYLYRYYLKTKEKECLTTKEFINSMNGEHLLRKEKNTLAMNPMAVS